MTTLKSLLSQRVYPKIDAKKVIFTLAILFVSSLISCTQHNAKNNHRLESSDNAQESVNTNRSGNLQSPNSIEPITSADPTVIIYDFDSEIYRKYTGNDQVAAAIEQIKNTKECNRCSFLNVDLSGQDFSQVNFVGNFFVLSDVSKTSFLGANLGYSAFVHTNGQEASFELSDLSGTLFIRGDYSDANFHKASLGNARFRGSVLDRARFLNVDTGNGEAYFTDLTDIEKAIYDDSLFGK